MIKFYDTSSLLMNYNNLSKEHFAISSITLQELENIKTSNRKEEDVKHNARLITKYLANSDNYTVHIFNNNMLKPIEEKSLEITNDTKILATAIDFDTNDETIFVTNDLALKNIANLFFGEDSIMSITDEDSDSYCGYIEVTMTDEELSQFYLDKTQNPYDVLEHQYLIIKNTDG